jgi:hypothetical protein
MTDIPDPGVITTTTTTSPAPDAIVTAAPVPDNFDVLLSRPVLMTAVLVLGVLFLFWSFWRAQKAEYSFNALDLVMQDGKVSRIGTSYMIVLGVTTWIMVNLTLNGRLTEAYFMAYVTAWVAPLVARVVFGQTTPPDQKKDSD